VLRQLGITDAGSADPAVMRQILAKLKGDSIPTADEVPMKTASTEYMSGDSRPEADSPDILEGGAETTTNSDQHGSGTDANESLAVRDPKQFAKNLRVINKLASELDSLVNFPMTPHRTVLERNLAAQVLKVAAAKKGLYPNVVPTTTGTIAGRIAAKNRPIKQIDKMAMVQGFRKGWADTYPGMDEVADAMCASSGILEGQLREPVQSKLAALLLDAFDKVKLFPEIKGAGVNKTASSSRLVDAFLVALDAEMEKEAGLRDSMSRIGRGVSRAIGYGALGAGLAAGGAHAMTGPGSHADPTPIVAPAQTAQTAAQAQGTGTGTAQTGSQGIGTATLPHGTWSAGEGFPTIPIERAPAHVLAAQQGAVAQTRHPAVMRAADAINNMPGGVTGAAGLAGGLAGLGGAAASAASRLGPTAPPPARNPEPQSPLSARAQSAVRTPDRPKKTVPAPVAK
jgi:hypothetical protein